MHEDISQSLLRHKGSDIADNEAELKLTRVITASAVMEFEVTTGVQVDSIGVIRVPSNLRHAQDRFNASHLPQESPHELFAIQLSPCFHCGLLARQLHESIIQSLSVVATTQIDRKYGAIWCEENRNMLLITEVR